MRLSLTLCLILVCVGLSVVTEGKRTTKSLSYSSTKNYYSSKQNSNSGGRNPDGTYCELLDLPQVCTLEYRPVCAHIRDCEGDSCFETAGNICAACSGGTYDYFIPGECPEEEEDGPEENDKLHCELLDVPAVCPQVDDPVCAHLRDCEGGSCFQTIGNGCTACSSEGVYDYFVSGECPQEDNRLYCELLDIAEVCPQVYDPVCAHLRDCKNESSCFQTVDNGCTACKGTFDYFVLGECPNQPERKYCDDNNRPKFCTKEYFPVCAHHADCDKDDAFSTAGNPCMACSDSNVDYYTLGAC